MSALIWDSSSGTYKESEIPKVYSGGVWQDTEGKVWNGSAWVDAWTVLPNIIISSTYFQIYHGSCTIGNGYVSGTVSWIKGDEVRWEIRSKTTVDLTNVNSITATVQRGEKEADYPGNPNGARSLISIYDTSNNQLVWGGDGETSGNAVVDVSNINQPVYILLASYTRNQSSFNCTMSNLIFAK